MIRVTRVCDSKPEQTIVSLVSLFLPRTRTFSLIVILVMPVKLPPQPLGDTRLPPPPSDPPTLADISESVVYNKQLRISRGIQVRFVSVAFLPDFWLHCIQKVMPRTRPHWTMKVGDKFTKQS